MISVIIPLYNKEAIVERSVKSVLSQDYDDFEVVVVNDGSTDRSAEIVKSIHNPRITLIEQENGGPSKARNTGVKHAKGEWILFLDADDELLPGALNVFVNLACENNGVNVIDCGSVTKIHNTKEEKRNRLNGYSRVPMRDWYFNRIGPGSNHSIFKKDLLLLYPYNEDLYRFEDAELLIRLLEVAKVYSSSNIVALVNADYASASKKCCDVHKDYAAYLSMKGKDFWAKMCVYRIYLENRDLYPEDMKRLYPTWRYRYDLLFLYKLFNLFR